jgi:ribose transport system ATP-binding protein
VSAPRLTLRHLSKTFGGARALDDVDMTVLPGEVHGLLGENGSGKSTLIKILAGYHAPDLGELEVDGKPTKLPLHPGQFRELGMSFVHQDLGLVDALSVLENLRVGEFAASRDRWRISWRRERRRARETFARYGVRLDPDAKVGSLSGVERALLAIVRAVEEMDVSTQQNGSGLLVLDEPTVFLPQEGTERLFALVREIAASGSSVLFVSHDMDEVREVTDRVTVLRDGRVVATVATADASKARLVEMIIGRRLEELEAEHHDLTGAETDAAVRGLSGTVVRDVSFELHAGEVLGLTGLLGSGFDEVPYLVFGAVTARGGSLRLGAATFDLPRLRPDAALEAGIALLPANRQQHGSVASLPVADNVSLPVLDEYFSGIRLERRRMLQGTRRLLQEFDVRPSDPHLPYGALSGGNQQKALLAKWLQTRPKLLLLHEPTQGVDVGARQQIFGLIREAAESGVYVVCASADYEQLALICDRILVLGRGRIARQLVGDAITKDRIIEQCYAASAAEEAAVLA